MFCSFFVCSLFVWGLWYGMNVSTGFAVGLKVFCCFILGGGLLEGKSYAGSQGFFRVCLGGFMVCFSLDCFYVSFWFCKGLGDVSYERPGEGHVFSQMCNFSRRLLEQILAWEIDG